MLIFTEYGAELRFRFCKQALLSRQKRSTSREFKKICILVQFKHTSCYGGIAIFSPNQITDVGWMRYVLPLFEPNCTSLPDVVAEMQK